jgi:predicted nucleic acid-binding protein
VLDGSVALSWAFADERSSQSIEVLDALSLGEADVPALWPLEVANGIATALRKKRLELHSALTYLSDIGKARIIVWPVESRSDALFASAQKHQLTPYDATYVELALRLSLPLATFDSDMRAAAQRAGVALVV